MVITPIDSGMRKWERSRVDRFYIGRRTANTLMHQLVRDELRGDDSESGKS